MILTLGTWHYNLPCDVKQSMWRNFDELWAWCIDQLRDFIKVILHFIIFMSHAKVDLDTDNLQFAFSRLTLTKYVVPKLWKWKIKMYLKCNFIGQITRRIFFFVGCPWFSVITQPEALFCFIVYSYVRIEGWFVY